MKSETQTEPVHLALVGCGRIAQSYLEALASIPQCHLKGVVDVRQKAVESVASQFGCRAYTDYRDCLEGNRLQAVLICTPPHSHCEIASFFLENGVHVLCEKPLAINSAEAAQMVRKSEENDCVLMMGSKFRYVEDIVKARGIVESGILGEVILFENVFCSKVDMRKRWNSNKEIAGGGVLIDNGSHSVDIARFLLGPIVKVQAEEGKRIQGTEVEDTCRLYFRTESDVMGDIDLSWSLYKERESYIDVFGTEGVLSIGWDCSKYRQSEKLDWVKFGNGYDKLSAFGSQVKNFVDSCQGVGWPLITATDSLESVKVIEAAYRSASMNKWIAVDPEKTHIAAVG